MTMAPRVDARKPAASVSLRLERRRVEADVVDAHRREDRTPACLGEGPVGADRVDAQRAVPDAPDENELVDRVDGEGQALRAAERRSWRSVWHEAAGGIHRELVDGVAARVGVAPTLGEDIREGARVGALEEHDVV